MKRLKYLIFLPLLILGQSYMVAQTKSHDFTLSLGYGYRLASKTNEHFTNQFEDSKYFSKTKHGLTLDFDYEYRYSKTFGFGFKASAFNSYSALGDTLGSKDDLYIFYFGPSAKYDFYLDNKSNFYIRGSIGYISLRNSITEAAPPSIPPNPMASSTDSRTYSGSSLGYGLDIGYNYRLNDFLSLDFNTGILGGTVSKLKYGEDEFKLDNNENLFRLHIGFGAKISL